MKFPIVALVLVCAPVLSAYAQKRNQSFRLHIRPATSPVKIDGVADEKAWQDADLASDFYMVLPMDTSHSRVRTDVKMTYDKENIYILAICYNGVPGPYMVESLRRDFNFVKNDNFLVFIDPFEDQTTGFSFGANAAGAQWDGSMYEGGRVDLNWDNKWYSAVKNYPDKYIFEAAIPFKTLRYKQNLTEWGINFSRNDLKTEEKSSWTPIPRQFPTAALAFTGTLVWDSPPPPPGLNVSVIPYALGEVSRDYGSQSSAAYRATVGGDAKIGVTSSLNLDLTVNPDFSQVDVDQQVTDLSRFELFYPERRQFFLENGDQFNNFGYPTIRPFFSRRIGLDAPIEFGARLSGKLDKNWRLGAMDMQTGGVDSVGLPMQNFSAIALQRKIFSRSNIGFIFVNKQSIHYNPGADSSQTLYSQYNRTAGVEFNLASANNMLTGKMLLLKTFSPGVSNNDWVNAGHLQYSARKWLLLFEYESVGNNFNAEVGYVPRQNYIKFNPQVAHYFFPDAGPVLSHGPLLNATYYYDQAFRLTDDEVSFSYPVTFRDRTTISPVVLYDYVELLQPFDPTNTGKDSLPTGSMHRWPTAGVDIVSRPQSLFTYTFSARYGGYYADGNKLSLAASVGYRFQPYVSLNLNVSYNDLLLPLPWGDTKFWLVGPRFDVTFTNTLFFTAFVQYNQQTNNMNVNSRIQWRFKPASDLFLVYNENYLPGPLSVVNRQLVLKFNYWWNL